MKNPPELFIDGTNLIEPSSLFTSKLHYWSIESSIKIGSVTILSSFRISFIISSFCKYDREQVE
jgi:hypothetical protein